MTPLLTIVYTTARKQPMIQWFLESLHRETAGDYTGIEIIVVDSYFGTAGRRPDCFIPGPEILRHTPPRPNAWNGAHRLTKEDWWAVASTRNGAICQARGDWIAFVDDLSFLMPGWLTQARNAMLGKRIVCGAYRKVKDLNIQGADLVGFTDYPAGKDARWDHGSDDGPVHCIPSWMYGCSLVAPVEAFLSVNGYDERCDGLSFEDSICGIHLGKKGWAFAYNRRMLTLESEEHHFIGPQIRRSDYGVSPKDKSHKILELAQNGDGWSPNDFGEFSSLRNLRKHILAGGEFPKVRGPLREWYTGTPMSEL